jgi:hypothetical protein
MSMARKEAVMFGGISVALGIGLLIVWISALSAHATPWLSWFDGLIGLGAIFLGVTALRATARPGIAGWGSVALGLFILWIVGLSARSTPWLAWWTFAFACAFVVLATSSTAESRRLHQRTV